MCIRDRVKEITAPDGMVIDPEPKEVVLSYAGQEVEITSASVGFYNERQNVEISLKKLLEQDETCLLYTSIPQKQKKKDTPAR